MSMRFSLQKKLFLLTLTFSLFMPGQAALTAFQHEGHTMPGMSKPKPKARARAKRRTTTRRKKSVSRRKRPAARRPVTSPQKTPPHVHTPAEQMPCNRRPLLKNRAAVHTRNADATPQHQTRAQKTKRCRTCTRRNRRSRKLATPRS